MTGTLAAVGWAVFIGSVLLLGVWLSVDRYTRKSAAAAYSLLSLAALGGITGAVFGILAGTT